MSAPRPVAARSRRPGPLDRIGRHWVQWFAAGVLLYLFVPIGYVLAFSFNDSRRSNYVWQGFTLRNWLNPCGQPQLCEAVGNSARVGIVATVVATILGTMIAFALGRYRFAGKSAVTVLIFLPMATPEVVMGASLLTLFLQLGPLGLKLGFTTVVIAHVMFCLSFVVVAVRARISTLDPRLEQAAADLYASEWQTFVHVTLPLVAPAIGGAALLAFSLSFDDYIITAFNSGSLTTFPIYVYAAAHRGVPAQAYAVGSGMFLLALFLVLASEVLKGRRRTP